MEKTFEGGVFQWEHAKGLETSCVPAIETNCVLKVPITLLVSHSWKCRKLDQKLKSLSNFILRKQAIFCSELTLHQVGRKAELNNSRMFTYPFLCLVILEQSVGVKVLFLRCKNLFCTYLLFKILCTH